MKKFQARVVLRQSWNNFVDLPADLVSLLYNAGVSPQDVIVEIELHSQAKYYVGWSGMNTSSPSEIGIDPVLALALTMIEKQQVILSVIVKNMRTSRILLEPEQFSDWELVELHASYIESKLIEQSRCVAINQSLIIFPTKTSSVRLIVTEIGVDQDFALIDPFAEISIAPKKQEKKATPVTHMSKSSRPLLEPSAHTPSILKRGVSLPNSQFSIFNETPSTENYELYGNHEELKHIFGNSEFLAISILAGPSHKAQRGASVASVQRDASKQSESSRISTTILETKQVVAKFVNFTASPKGTVGLSKYLAIALRVENTLGYKVIVKPAAKCVSERLSSVIVHPYTTKEKKQDHASLQLPDESQAKIAQFFSETLLLDDSSSAIPISNFCRIPMIPKYLPDGGIMAFKKNFDQCAWMKITLKWPRIEFGTPIIRPTSEIQDKGTESDIDKTFGLEFVNEISEHISAFGNTGVMIHGTQGCGKTTSLKLLAQLVRSECVAFTRYVACENLMNETHDQIRASMAKWVNEAVWNQPSVIILDNLDKILSAEAENTDSSLSDQMTGFFISLLRDVRQTNNANVSLLIAGASKESFNKLLIQSQLIEIYSHVDAPNKVTRTKIIQNYLSTSLECVLRFDLMDIVLETEGYLPNDLKVLCDRMFYERIHQDRLTYSSISSVDNSVEIYKKDFEISLRGFKPSSLRGVKLEKSIVNWGDIGGMFQAKRILLETLEWPTKYAPIFANCALRLRSGLLLYGYPGCGKTLLASSIASQCGLNFISIKGPEILNKYIGASEQSVRDLFERAQAAKPCVLFFDEFDLIAPKRGHDSTGVTDRVVNQMLTQMDGAEGLDGVYVLAATSRPDLIDSALLRPGRLDKSVFCDMPGYRDRLDILSCISRKMNLLNDVRLETIAHQSSGFSGADLQGLGYNAYLKAVHERLSSEENLLKGEDSSIDSTHDYFCVESKMFKRKVLKADDALLRQQIESLAERYDKRKNVSENSSLQKNNLVVIKQSHFLESLKESKLSISASEKRKLQNIYSEFLTGRDGEMPDGSASLEVGGRATLM